MKSDGFLATLVGMLVIGAAAVIPAAARAHCDTMDGPVVKAARQALEKEDVNRVLIWVKSADEPAIREAFKRTLVVRKLGPEAKDLADRWFFETLVRLHRTGEGAPYTGLKPAGQDLGPAIPAADKALESGNLAPLTGLLTEAARTRLNECFKEALSAKKYAPGDVAAGRRYVESYVAFIHRAEAIWQAATLSPEGHYEEAAAGAAPHHEHAQR